MEQCVDNVLGGFLFEAKDITSASNKLSKGGGQFIVTNKLYWSLIQDSPMHTTVLTTTQLHKTWLSCRGSKYSAWVTTDRMHFHQATHIPLDDWKIFSQCGWWVTHQVQCLSVCSLLWCWLVSSLLRRCIRGSDISTYMQLAANVNTGMTFAVTLRKVKTLST